MVLATHVLASPARERVSRELCGFSLLSPSFRNSVRHTIKHLKIKKVIKREECSINQKREHEAEGRLAKPLVQAQLGQLLLWLSLGVATLVRWPTYSRQLWSNQEAETASPRGKATTWDEAGLGELTVLSEDLLCSSLITFQILNSKTI